MITKKVKEKVLEEFFQLVFKQLPTKQYWVVNIGDKQYFASVKFKRFK